MDFIARRIHRVYWERATMLSVSEPVQVDMIQVVAASKERWSGDLLRLKPLRVWPEYVFSTFA